MKWLRCLAWAVIGWLGLWLLAWLIVPPLLKSQAQQRLGSAVGRTVTLGDVNFSPWSLELTVRDIVIGGAPVPATRAGSASAAAAVPLLKVARFYVNADIGSVLHRAPVIEALEVDAPELTLTRTAEGHYDIDDLIARFGPDTSQPPASEPVPFALYNLKVRDASVTLDDRPVGEVHRLTAMNLSLPFLANLPAQIDVKVAPHLAFQLDGTSFDTGAQTTPFAQSRASTLQFKMGELDLKPYLGYLPDSLPIRLRQGRAAASLDLDFKLLAGASPNMVLRGKFSLQDIEVDDLAGAPLLAWKRLDVALRDIQPLKRALSFGAIELDAPTLHVVRDASGRVNLTRLSGPAPGAVPAPEGAGSQASAPTAAPAMPWKVQVDSLHIGGWQVLWSDAGLTPAVALAAEAIDLKAGPFNYPFAADAAMPVSLKATLRAAGADAPLQGRVSVDGRISDSRAVLDLQVGDLNLDALAPYLAESLEPKVSGVLTASAQLSWAAGEQPTLKIGRGEAVLDGLRVTEAGAPAAQGKGAALPAALGLKQLTVHGAEVDLQAHTLSLAGVKFIQPTAAVSRDRAGQWNVQRWMKPAGGATLPVATAGAGSASSPSVPAPAGSADVPWRIELRDLAIEGGSLRLDDAFVVGRPDSEPVRLEVAALKFGMQNLALSGARTTAPARLQLSARLLGPRDLDHAPTRGGAAASGTLDWRGQLGLQPLMVLGSVKMERFPVQAVEPYVRDRLPVSLLRAEAGLKADVSVKELPSGLDIGVAGDLLLADVLVHSRPVADARAGLGSTEELLSWQSFQLNGVTLALAPARPPKIDITEAVLADFYSRLVITEQGRFNLQDVAPAAAAASSAESAPAPAAVPPEVASAAVPAVSASQAGAVASAPAFELSVGATRLINGRIDFTDRFVRPNYSADLSQLNGSLGAFRSGSREMATLELHGRAAGTALLDISGQLNPTAEPLALNIRAKATDLELAPLSPYAGKYAGYAIERGKLSMDVSYAISADGRLEAKNQIILNQLTFGDRIESPTATKLPVLLAVALLKDRHGVIDINLPISGSLNDPQFSVGGIIFKVIVNLIAKALTAPFSLLFGGSSEDLSQVDFRPGVSAVTESGAAALDKVAQALIDRPSLKMTVTGVSDPVAEREAFVQAALDARLAQEKKKEAARAGAPADAASVPPQPETWSGAERERLLKAVYRQTDIPDKPRNLVGLAKDIPAAEMEVLLKSRLVVTDEAMRELALQRGLVVRDALIAKGLPSERLFIASPKMRASQDSAESWAPSARLSLTNN